MENRSERMTIRLGKEHAGLLDKLEEYTGLNRTRLIRIIIDQTAINLGMEPVGKIPKYFSHVEQIRT